MLILHMKNGNGNYCHLFPRNLCHCLSSGGWLAGAFPAAAAAAVPSARICILMGLFTQTQQWPRTGQDGTWYLLIN